MTDRDPYTSRPEKVWPALTGPAHRREWAPFDADGSMGPVGTPKLAMVPASAPPALPDRPEDCPGGSLYG